MLLQALCCISPHLATALVILLKLDSNRRFFSPCDLEIWWMTQRNNRVPLPCYFKFLQHFIAIGDFKLELLSGNAQFGSNSTIYIEEHIYIYINRASWREQRSSGGNTSSNPQVSAPVSRPVVNGMERMCQRHRSDQAPTLQQLIDGMYRRSMMIYSSP